MRDLVILFVHVIGTLARLLGPGGIRSVVAESVLIKEQLLILNRSRQRSPNLCTSDRLVAGLCALLIRPARLIRSAIVLKPSTLLSLHRTLRNRKYRMLFSPKRRRRPGSMGPSRELIEAVVQTKQRNPSWGCPRIEGDPSRNRSLLESTNKCSVIGLSNLRCHRVHSEGEARLTLAEREQLSPVSVLIRQRQAGVEEFVTSSHRRTPSQRREAP